MTLATTQTINEKPWKLT